MRNLLVTIAGMLAVSICAAQGTAPSKAAALVSQPAIHVPYAATAAMLGSAHAGSRLVAVGDHGVVLLSDDDGKQWRQARAVPVRSMLTSVSFVDDKQGWAVGHWGVIVHTLDGGETWTLQRSDTEHDRPLFSVLALDASHVVAVGLWSLVLTTDDSGHVWQTQTLEPPPAGDGDTSKHADLNLFALFADSRGKIFAAAERGMVLRSDDQGRRWSYLSSGYKGSFWTGASPAPGVLVAAGLRGSIYRSADDGATWARIDSHFHSSITGATVAGNELVLVGMDGVMLKSRDFGGTFQPEVLPGRPDLTTSLVTKAGRLVVFSRSGVVHD